MPLPEPLPGARAFRRRLRTLGLLACLAACGDDPASPVGRDLDALCAGRPTDLAIRLAVTSVTNMDVAVGDTLAGTLRFTPEEPVGGTTGPCAVAGSVRLETTAAVLAWVRDSTVPTFQTTGSGEGRGIGIAGTGEGHVFMAVLPVRGAVGTWDYFIPARSAGVSGTILYAGPDTR